MTSGLANRLEVGLTLLYTSPTTFQSEKMAHLPCTAAAEPAPGGVAVVRTVAARRAGRGCTARGRWRSARGIRSPTSWRPSRAHSGGRRATTACRAQPERRTLFSLIPTASTEPSTYLRRTGRVHRMQVMVFDRRRRDSVLSLRLLMLLMAMKLVLMLLLLLLLMLMLLLEDHLLVEVRLLSGERCNRNSCFPDTTAALVRIHIPRHLVNALRGTTAPSLRAED